MIDKKRIGIALSGGGYRAAAFHVGTLKKLNEMGILENVDVISTISGGSITGAAYCLHRSNFEEFEKTIIDAIGSKSVIRYILRSRRFLMTFIPASILCLGFIILPFTEWANYSLLPLLVLVFLLIRYQFKLLPVSVIVEKAYDDIFYKHAKLSDLCTIPELAIGATNLQTMRPFTFSKRKMEDSEYARYNPPVLFENRNFPVSRAVAASTCVPFAFSPITIDKKYFCDPTLVTVINPVLVDGGVYDNQGIHKLTQRNSSYACDIVIVSDAGNKLPFKEAYRNTFTLLLRSVNVFMVRIKHFQMIQNIYENHYGRHVAYQSLGWDLKECIPGFYSNLLQRNIPEDVIKCHGIPATWINNLEAHKQDILDYLKIRCRYDGISSRELAPYKLDRIRKVSTNLMCLKIDIIQDLIIHAENLTELQIRLYCPSVLISSAQKN